MNRSAPPTFSRVLMGLLAISALMLQACGPSQNASPASEVPKAAAAGEKPADKPAEKAADKPPEGAPKAEGAAGAAGGAPAPAKPDGPPVSVSTVEAQVKDVDVAFRTQGTVQASNVVDVKPQASSVVTQVHIREGQMVKKGTLLFTLDSRLDEANLAKAKAQLARDTASLADAKRQLERAKELQRQGFVSQVAVDTATTQVEGLTAALALDQAGIDAAQVSVANAKVVAPSGGRVGMIPVSVGSAVVANQTVLLTIAQLDPIEVLFSVPQRNLGDLMKSAKQGEVKVSASLLEGGPAAEGALRFVDSLVDPLTGSVKAKASFENKGMRLWPGAAVEVRQVMRTIKDAVVIPTAAVVQNQRGTIVYVVEAERAVSKPVKVVSVDASGSVVTGLEPGEKVVLDGKQNVRPGSKLVERAKPEAKPEGKSEGKSEGKPEGKPAAEGKGKPEGAAKP